MIATVLSLFISDPFPLGSPLSFIIRLFFHLYPTRGQLMAYADPYPISLLQTSLGGDCKAKKVLFGDNFLINAVRELATEYLMRW